jgi:hypothetical protein
MTGVLDARLSTRFTNHPKTLKLVRRLGPAGGWHLVCLILWTAANKPDGDLQGLSAEDIEIACGWMGEPELLVAALRDLRFLDGDAGSYRLHDWTEHQPWATGAEARSERGRWAGLCSKLGRAEAERLMPEYSAKVKAKEASTSSQHPVAPVPTGSQPAVQQVVGIGSTPSPSPSPSPNTPLSPQGGQTVGSAKPAVPGDDDPLFIAFYGAYPRKTQRAAAWRAWRALKPDAALLHDMLAGLAKWQAHERWTRESGRFVHIPSTWLNQRLWEDEEVCGRSQSGTAGTVPEWVTRAGFENEAHAANLRCYAHNASEFRDGRRIPAEAAA